MGVLIDGFIETVKHEIKKQEGESLGDLLAPLAISFVQPATSSVVKNIIGRVSVKEQKEELWLKLFCSGSSFKQFQDYYLFQI